MSSLYCCIDKTHTEAHAIFLVKLPCHQPRQAKITLQNKYASPFILLPNLYALPSYFRSPNTQIKYIDIFLREHCTVKQHRFLSHEMLPLKHLRIKRQQPVNIRPNLPSWMGPQSALTVQGSSALIQQGYTQLWISIQISDLSHHVTLRAIMGSLYPFTASYQGPVWKERSQIIYSFWQLLSQACLEKALRMRGSWMCTWETGCGSLHPRTLTALCAFSSDLCSCTGFFSSVKIWGERKMFAEVSGLLPYTFLGHRKGVCMREEKLCCSESSREVTSVAASAKDGNRFVQALPVLDGREGKCWAGISELRRNWKLNNRRS